MILPFQVKKTEGSKLLMVRTALQIKDLFVGNLEEKKRAVRVIYDEILADSENITLEIMAMITDAFDTFFFKQFETNGQYTYDEFIEARTEKAIDFCKESGYVMNDGDDIALRNYMIRQLGCQKRRLVSMNPDLLEDKYLLHHIAKLELERVDKLMVSENIDLEDVYRVRY